MVCFEDDIAAITPIAAIRAAHGNEFFPAETASAVPPGASLDMNFDLVDKHGNRTRIKKKIWGGRKFSLRVRGKR